MSVGRRRRVSKSDLLRFLEKRPFVTFSDLQRNFSTVSFDEQTAYNWLVDAAWEQRRPRSREIWQPKKSDISPKIRRARNDLSEILIRYHAKAFVSTIGVVVLLEDNRTSGSVADLFRDAELPDVHLPVATVGGVLLSVHPGSQSNVVSAIRNLMADPMYSVLRATAAA